MNKRHWTKKELRHISKAYKAGASRLSLCRHYSVKIDAINRALREASTDIRSEWRKSLLPDAEQEVVRRYVAGESALHLGEEFGVSRATIANIVHRYGEKTRPRGNTFREFTPEQIKEIRLRASQGQSSNSMYDSMGISPGIIKRAMFEHGITPAICPPRRREDHEWWKGGRRVDNHGYVFVTVPDGHPFSGMSEASGAVREHRLVMAEAIGRPLLDSESVHHINGDRSDNRLENLQLRAGIHGTGIAYHCADCGSTNIVPTLLKERSEVYAS